LKGEKDPVFRTITLHAPFNGMAASLIGDCIVTSVWLDACRLLLKLKFSE